MVSISQFSDSKYLKKEDVEGGKVLTVKACSQEDLSQEGQRPEFKFVLWFEETERGLVMNPTNGQLAATALGSGDTDDWIGKKLELWNDPSVGYAGKITGGIRVKPEAPKGDPDSDLPF